MDETKNTMNEQIQKLAEQAGMYVDLNGNPWPKWMSAEECELAYAKFAKLIVSECINAIDDGDGSMSSMAESSWRSVCIEEIKQHFGVEE